MMYQILVIAMCVFAVNACGPDPTPVTPATPSLCSQMTTIPFANKCPPGIAKYLLVETYQAQDYTATPIDKTACGAQMSVCSLLNRDKCGALKLELIEGQLGALAKIEGYDSQLQGFSTFIFNWTVLATDKVYFEQQLIFWGTISAALALTAPTTIPDVLMKAENMVGFGVIGRGNDYLLLQTCCKKLAFLFINETVVETLPPCTGGQKPQYPQLITQGITADLQNVQLNYSQFMMVNGFSSWSLKCDPFIAPPCAAATTPVTTTPVTTSPVAATPVTTTPVAATPVATTPVTTTPVAATPTPAPVGTTPTPTPGLTPAPATADDK